MGHYSHVFTVYTLNYIEKRLKKSGKSLRFPIINRLSCGIAVSKNVIFSSRSFDIFFLHCSYMQNTPEQIKYNINIKRTFYFYYYVMKTHPLVDIIKHIVELSTTTICRLP